MGLRSVGLPAGHGTIPWGWIQKRPTQRLVPEEVKGMPANTRGCYASNRACSWLLLLLIQNRLLRGTLQILSPANAAGEN